MPHWIAERDQNDLHVMNAMFQKEDKTVKTYREPGTGFDQVRYETLDCFVAPVGVAQFSSARGRTSLS
eukprot:12900160-Prorocentrum_lima.AAC.1